MNIEQVKKLSRYMNRETIELFKRDWSRNWEANWPRVKDLASLKSLAERFSGVPCLAINAGPSLDRDMHLLRGLKGRVLMICVDRAYPNLRMNGVEPDMVITLDPQPVVATWFQGHRRGIPVAMCPWQDPGILDNVPATDIISYVENNDQNPFWVEIENKYAALDRFGWIPPGGTVGSAAAGMALALDCDPIMFTGLDLSYGFFTGSDGNQAYRTIPAFELSRRWYEECLFPQSQKTYVNCSETSILRENCITMPLEFAAEEWGLHEPRNFAWEIRRKMRKGRSGKI